MAPRTQLRRQHGIRWIWFVGLHLSLPSLEFVRGLEQNGAFVVQHLKRALKTLLAGKRAKSLIIINGEVNCVVFDEEEYEVVFMV